jgi:hypothetical protein
MLQSRATIAAPDLSSLFAPSSEATIDILRGLLHNGRTGQLAAVGPAAPALVDFILNKDCPVSASLTDADKAQLLRIKQEATKKPGG